MNRRYAVVKINRFGDSLEMSYWDCLEDALSERDLHRREQFTPGPRRETFIVLDREDPTRGPLDHSDAYEVNA